jgi:Ca2+-binding EF-hand superfamily protein
MPKLSGKFAIAPRHHAVLAAVRSRVPAQLLYTMTQPPELAGSTPKLSVLSISTKLSESRRVPSAELHSTGHRSVFHMEVHDAVDRWGNEEDKVVASSVHVPLSPSRFGRTTTTLPPLRKQHPPNSFPRRDVRLGHWDVQPELISSLFTSHSGCTTLELSSLGGIVTPTVLLNIAGTFANLTSLRVDDCHQVTDDGLISIAKTLTSLEKLDISGCVQVTDVAIKSLAVKAVSLKHVRMRRLPRLTDAGCITLTERPRACVSWVSLDVAECAKLTDRGLLAVASSSSRLRRLCMSDIPLAKELSLIGLNTPVLEWLDVGDTPMRDEAMVWIAKGAPKLRYLRIANCREVTSRGISMVLEECTCLETLDGTNLRGAASTLFEAAAESPFIMHRSLPCSLEKVVLDGVMMFRDAGLIAMGTLCPNLQSMSLVGNSHLTDRGIMDWAKKCPQLQELHLTADYQTNVGDPFSCARVSDAGLRCIAAGCPRLRSIRVSACHRLSDKGVLVLAAKCRELVCVHLSTNPRISDTSLLAIGSACPNLEELNISHCEDCSDDGLVSVIRNCTRLTTLYAGNCHRLTDKSLIEMSRYSGLLRTLRVPQCPRLTDLGLSRLASRCWLLEDASFAWCEEISGFGVWMLARRCRGLTRLVVDGCRRIKPYHLALASSMLPLSRVSGVIHGLESSYVGEELRVRKAAVLNELHLVRSCMKLQSRWRARMARWLAGKLRQAWRLARDAVEFSAALMIQKHVRGFLARRLFRAMVERRDRAVCTIQAVMRGKRVRWYFRGVLFQFHRETRRARIIQRWWREILEARADLRRRLALAKDMLRVHIVSKAHAWMNAWTVQRAWRYHHARCVVYAKYRMDTRACKEIQRVWRGHQARQYCRSVRKARTRVVLALQICVRARQSFRKAWERRTVACREHYAALLVQRTFRGYIARKRILKERVAWRKYREQRLAACESVARSLVARLARERWAAMSLQRLVRGHFGRNLYRTLKAHVELERKRYWASRLLVRTYRKYRVRTFLAAQELMLRRLRFVGSYVDGVLARKQRIKGYGAAMIIQRRWRWYKSRKDASSRMCAFWRACKVREWVVPWGRKCISSAILLQRFMRRRWTLMYWRVLVRAAQAANRTREAHLQRLAATLIQHRWKSWKEARERQAIVNAEMRLQRDLENVRRGVMQRDEQERHVAGAAETEAESEAARDLSRKERRNKAAQLAIAVSPIFSMLLNAIPGLRPSSLKHRPELVIHKEEQEFAAMEHAIHKYMRRSALPDGITAMRLTVGKEEREQFERAQREAQAAGELHFTMLPVDLSAPLPSREIRYASMLVRKAQVREALVQAGTHPAKVDDELDQWEANRSASREAKQVYLWTKTEQSPNVITDVSLHVVPRRQPRQETHDARDDARSRGLDVVYHRKEGLRLEIHHRSDGNQIVTALAAAPVCPTAPEERQLRDLGMTPLDVDLSEAGLSEGLQLWVRKEGSGEPAQVKELVERLEREKFWSPELFRAIEILQLTVDNIQEWYDVFDKLQDDVSGRIPFEEFVKWLGVAPSAFSKGFLDMVHSGRFVDGSVDFPAFVRVATAVGLMDDMQLAGMTFAFLDSDGLGAVTLATLKSGIQSILETASGGITARQIMPVVAKLRRDTVGLIRSDTFIDYVMKQQPAWIYPLVVARTTIHKDLTGVDWWQRKQTRYAEVRNRLKRTRELARIAAQSRSTSNDPEKLVSRYNEIVAERSPLVAQCFVQPVPGGKVAVVVPNRANSIRWSTRIRRLVLPPDAPDGDDHVLRFLCSMNKLQAAVAESIAQEEDKEGMLRRDAVTAVVLTPLFFSMAAHTLINESPAPPGCGPLLRRGEPDRSFLKRLYQEEILAMAEELAESQRGLSATARNVELGLRAAHGVAAAIGRRAMRLLRPPKVSEHEEAERIALLRLQHRSATVEGPDEASVAGPDEASASASSVAMAAEEDTRPSASSSRAAFGSGDRREALVQARKVKRSLPKLAVGLIMRRIATD